MNTLLFIEDDDGIRLALRLALEDEGYTVHEADDGAAGLVAFAEHDVDLVLLDLRLPDMSGFDLLDMLSPHVLQGGVDPLLSGSRISLDRIGHGMRSGIFIVSDNYCLEEEQRALTSGVAGYLVRPITLDVIRATRMPAELLETPAS